MNNEQLINLIQDSVQESTQKLKECGWTQEHIDLVIPKFYVNTVEDFSI